MRRRGAYQAPADAEHPLFASANDSSAKPDPSAKPFPGRSPVWGTVPDLPAANALVPSAGRSMSAPTAGTDGGGGGGRRGIVGGGALDAPCQRIVSGMRVVRSLAAMGGEVVVEATPPPALRPVPLPCKQGRFSGRPGAVPYGGERTAGTAGRGTRPLRRGKFFVNFL